MQIVDGLFLNGTLGPSCFALVSGPRDVFEGLGEVNATASSARIPSFSTPWSRNPLIFGLLPLMNSFVQKHQQLIEDSFAVSFGIGRSQGWIRLQDKAKSNNHVQQNSTRACRSSS